MNTLPNHVTPAPETFVNSLQNEDFVSKLRAVVEQIQAQLNAGLAEPHNVVALGICAVQLDGLSTCLLSDSADKPMNPGMRMAAAILGTCLQGEDDPRVQPLLAKAQKLTEQALKIRTGEIITSTLH